MDSDDLYGLPLERFVQERGALARALRADGRRDEAAAVAGLRKPSVAGWAVNQLVRSQAAAIRELFAAGDALRDAQADLLAGRGDGPALRAARERERAAVDGLVENARGLLTSEGHELSPAVVDRVLDTLHAAALDEDAREQVRAGRLERELRHVGLGLGEAGAAAPPASAGTARATRDVGDADTKPRHAKRDREARERAAEAARVEQERAAARKAARATETAAQRRVQSAARALRDAQERRDRAARGLDDAEGALACARAEADDATAAHRRARADLERL